MECVYVWPNKMWVFASDYSDYEYKCFSDDYEIIALPNNIESLNDIELFILERSIKLNKGITVLSKEREKARRRIQNELYNGSYERRLQAKGKDIKLVYPSRSNININVKVI